MIIPFIANYRVIRREDELLENEKWEEKEIRFWNSIENFAGKLYRKSDDEIILFDFIVYRTCVYYVYYKQYVNKLGKGWCIRLSIGIISLRKCEVYSRRRISTMNSFVEINRKILTRNSKICNVSSSESGYIIRFERKSKL